MRNRRIIQSFAFFAFMAAFLAHAVAQEPAEVSESKESPAVQGPANVSESKESPVQEPANVSESKESPAVESKWGNYDGDPVTKWNPDGRTMTLLTELRYTDPNGNVWVAPIGSVVDGASIPRYLWSIMGGPFEGKYRNASVLHDVAYGEHKRPWQDCDRMFYYAMRCSGVSAGEAKTMFYALFRFGHHWKFPIKRAKPVKYEGGLVARGEEIPRAIPVNPAQIDQAQEWISNSNPSLDQIEQRANEENR
jgi:hypothetical protein